MSTRTDLGTLQNPDFYDDDHHTFRSLVQAFVTRDVAPHHERFRDERGIDRDTWLRAGELGILGFAVPEELGGGGVSDFRFNAIVIEEMSRQGLALGSAFQIHIDVVAPYLLELATPEQQKRWLPGFASGELVTAVAMTEPGGGSDLGSLTTRAERDGDSWVLNGAKTFITNGIGADLVVVAARTGPGERKHGISLFVVEADTPGFERGRKLTKIGQPEADTAELFFSDARVPLDNLLGEVGGGFSSMMTRLPQERLSTAISNIAHARAVVEETLEYVKERRAFGSPIGSFQANRFTMAEVVTSLDVADVYAQQCLMAHVRRELSAVDAAKAKWWSAEVQNQVIDHCLQMFGGYGYMDEVNVGRAWTDARVSKIWAGSNEIMKEIIGRSLGL